MNTHDYGYREAGPTGTAEEICAAVLRTLVPSIPTASRVLDLGCGNGYFTQRLVEAGYSATGVDTSASGIAIAQASYPQAKFFCGLSDELIDQGESPFDAVVSIEVIEHCPSVSSFCKGLARSIKPGGLGIVTTPYHGYIKNLAIALLGKGDAHYNPLWEGGHIKFFSPKTLTEAMHAARLNVLGIDYVGRVPVLAKSMVMSVQKSSA